MADMLTFSVQSGSNGNSIYVEAGDTRVLFDAGVSGRTLRERMAVHGRDPRELHALVISHEHNDHIRCAGIYQRLFGMPIFMTRRTHRANRCNLGRVTDVRYFESGDTLRIGRLAIHTIPTPHDAADTIVFVVEFEGRRLGIFTDLGHPFAGLQQLIESVNAAYLESNYDPHMLAAGPYPPELKLRIAGNGGHISNRESADLVCQAAARRHNWIALSHLSEQNNKPELALDAHRSVIGALFPLEVSSRYQVSPIRSV